MSAASASAPRASVGLKQRWQALAARERAMLLLMVSALVAAAAWAGWLEPVLKQRRFWQAELPRLQAQSRLLAPLLQARDQQRQAQARPPTLAGLRGQIRAAGLSEAMRIDEREGRWHLQVQGVPADTLWNWLLPLLADPAVQLQQLKLQRTGDANMPAARISGTIVVTAHGGGGR